MKSINIQFACGDCSLGCILVAMSEHGVCAIFLGDEQTELMSALKEKFPRAMLCENYHLLEASITKIIAFIESPLSVFDLPLDIHGSTFQRRVWQAITEIPAGMTASYTDIASRIGSPKSVRAVANACAANKLAVVIPCHRIVKNDGSLSGYRWGIERKRQLLNKERVSSCVVTSGF